MRAARWAAALALPLLLSVAACSEGDADQAVDQAREAASSAVGDVDVDVPDVDLPDVDWGQFGDRLQRQIDRAAENADCDALSEALTRYESLSNDVTDYIEAKIEEAGC